jgi:hypothetical protein
MQKIVTPLKVNHIHLSTDENKNPIIKKVTFETKSANIFTSQLNIEGSFFPALLNPDIKSDDAYDVTMIITIEKKVKK